MAIRSQAYSGIKEPVRYTTTGNIALSGLGTQANGDWPGVLSDGDRILVKDQSTPSENGIYDAALGSWTRSRDADKNGEFVSGSLVPVSEGSTLSSSLWNLVPAAPGAIDIGTTSFSFDLAQNTLLIPFSAIDQPNGVAGLDGSGKISTSALPPGGLTYQGTWDANSNTPTLADGVGSLGDLYVVSTAGTQDLGSGSISFSVGDFVIYNTSNVWEMVPTGGAGVSSVNTQTGAVVLNLDDINDVNTLSGSGNLLELDAGTWRRSDLQASAGTSSLSLQLDSAADGSSFVVDDVQIAVEASDSTTPNYYSDAPELKLHAKYDSDVNGPIVNTHYSFVIGGVMTAGAPTPAGHLKFDISGSNKMQLTSDGQLKVPTTGSSAGILIGGDVQLYRSAANVASLGAGDKIQQSEAPSAGDDLVNKTYVDGRALDDLNNVDTSGAVDGSLLRYEATGSTWADTTSTTLLLDDNGQLQVPTTGSSAGILIGGDVQLYRSAANIVSLGAGDKIQQSEAPTADDDLVNKAYVDARMPVGTIVDFAGTLAPPAGWLLCQGQEEPRATYSDLDTLITTTYGPYTDGAGNAGTTHFRVPDLRGRVSIGTGTGTGEDTSGTGLITGGSALSARTLGAWGGSETQTLTTAQLPSHDHTQPAAGTWVVRTGAGSFGFASGGSNAFSLNATNTANTGSGQAHNNIQPFVVLNKIIKY